ncbi:MAG: hypothetical protein ACI4EX_08425 [Lachnospiraceae bacterium]
MNPWIIDFCYFVLLLCFVIVGIASVVLLIVRKRKKKSIKSTVISLVISIFLLAVLILFIASHSTYYKYNDWAILQSNIRVVQQKYGDFDLGTIRDNQAGKVAYYIYTDNGPIMPDHLKHYYYMEYDEWGVIYKVYESCQPGG